MKAITSRVPKVSNLVYKPGSNSGYERPELTSDFVFKHAHLMSQDQMARMFCITDDTLMGEFGDDYRAGREHNRVKRKRDLEMLLDQLRPTNDPEEFWPAGYNHRLKEAKTDQFLQATGLWAKWFDGMGEKKETPVEEVSPLANLSAEDLEQQILEVARSKGWKPPDA